MTGNKLSSIGRMDVLALAGMSGAHPITVNHPKLVAMLSARIEHYTVPRASLE